MSLKFEEKTSSARALKGVSDVASFRTIDEQFL